jgi:hypothetical protein
VAGIGLLVAAALLMRFSWRWFSGADLRWARVFENAELSTLVRTLPLSALPMAIGAFACGMGILLRQSSIAPDLGGVLLLGLPLGVGTGALLATLRPDLAVPKPLAGRGEVRLDLTTFDVALAVLLVVISAAPVLFLLLAMVGAFGGDTR